MWPASTAVPGHERFKEVASCRCLMVRTPDAAFSWLVDRDSRVRSPPLGRLLRDIGTLPRPRRRVVAVRPARRPLRRVHGPQDSAGNGSLMRLAPVPMYYAGHAAEAIAMAADSSRTTWGRPRKRSTPAATSRAVDRRPAGRRQGDAAVPGLLPRVKGYGGATPWRRRSRASLVDRSRIAILPASRERATSSTRSRRPCGPVTAPTASARAPCSR